MARRLFDIDIAGVKQVFEDLAEALDVLGFPKPLASWGDEEAKVHGWIASLEEMEADEGLASVVEQLLAIERDLPKWANEEGLAPSAVAAGRNCLKQAREELAECCTYEDRD